MKRVIWSSIVTHAGLRYQDGSTSYYIEEKT